MYGVFDHSTKLCANDATGVIVTSTETAVCATEPRCTVTPQAYSTPDHSMVMVAGVDSLVDRTNSSDVDEARRPPISDATGRLDAWRVLNMRNARLGSTAEMPTVVVPSAVLVAAPRWTAAR